MSVRVETKPTGAAHRDSGRERLALLLEAHHRINNGLKRRQRSGACAAMDTEKFGGSLPPIRQDGKKQ